jgi:phage terminase large subunit-like protein
VEPTPDDEIVLGFDGSFSGDTTVVTGAIIPKTEDEPVKVFMVKSWERQPDDDDNWRVDISDVEQTIIDFCAKHPKVVEIACDPFRWQRSMQALQDRGLPIVEWPSTSARRMVAACAKVFDMVMENKLEHDGDPVVARHFQNAVVKVDNLGPRIVKEARHSPRKIDAAVSTIIAVDRATVSRMEQIVPEFFG